MARHQVKQLKTPLNTPRTTQNRLHPTNSSPGGRDRAREVLLRQAVLRHVPRAREPSHVRVVQLLARAAVLERGGDARHGVLEHRHVQQLRGAALDGLVVHHLLVHHQTV